MLYMQLGRFAVNIITTWEFPGFSTSYVLYCKLELRMKKTYVSLGLATRSCVDSSVIDAMAGCHGNGVALRDLTVHRL